MILLYTRAEHSSQPRYQDNKAIPLLVLANKQDLPEALGGPEVGQVGAPAGYHTHHSQGVSKGPKENQALGLLVHF